MRNKERLFEEDYGYHPSPTYQLDSVPVHGRGGGGGRRLITSLPLLYF